MKTCIRCQEEKPLESFDNHPTARDGKRNQCRSCRYQQRMARPGEKEKARAWNLGRYGITIDEYKDMLTRQGNVCAICKQTNTHKHGRLFVDHDHKTNKVRGLLCHSCNIMLGNAEDDPEILRAALRYLLESNLL